MRLISYISLSKKILWDLLFVCFRLVLGCLEDLVVLRSIFIDLQDSGNISATVAVIRR